MSTRTHTPTATTGTSGIRRAVVTGAWGGMAAAAAMAMYAMVVAGAVKHTGYLTPLYHIASSVISGQAMMHSMGAAMSGSAFYFTAGPALVGLVIHMMTGAVAGVAFAVAVSRRPMPSVLVVAAGAVFGLLVMLVNSFVVLPIAAKVFGGGDPIAHMGRMVGWGHFTVEHLIFGMVLGVIVAIFGVRRTSAEA